METIKKTRKVSETQVRASRNWERRNREKTKVDNARRQGRSFVRLYAEEKDIFELIEIYNHENKNKKSFLQLIKK